MKKNNIIFLLGIILIVACKQTPKVFTHNDIEKGEEVVEERKKDTLNTSFSIEILENEALNVIDAKTTIKVVASGFTWTEGPLWVEDGKFLLFSDIPENKVYKLDSKNDTITYLYPSGYTGKSSYSDESGSNGLILDKNGNLILLQHGDRRIAKMNAPLDNPKADFLTIVDNYENKKLNSPNDGFFDNNGNLYFTDPPYGLPGNMNDPNKMLDFQGVYCLLQTRELVLLDKLSRPNGITSSPDGKTLYVAVSDNNHAVWYQYDIIEPGKIANKKIFYDATYLVGKKGHQGLPDGMKTNSRGYIFATGPGGVWIFNNSAKVIAKIYTGQLTSNCALTVDEKKLFITADDFILSVDLK